MVNECHDVFWQISSKIVLVDNEFILPEEHFVRLSESNCVFVPLVVINDRHVLTKLDFSIT